MKCDDCGLAGWKRTSNGRLHPDKSGRCRWTYQVKLPSAFYWIGVAVPSGGYIERGKEIERCVHKQGASNPLKWQRAAGEME